MTYELDEYKRRVKSVALRAAKEHGWCSEVKELLRELDIDASEKWNIRLTVEVELEIDGAEDADSAEQIAHEWVSGVQGSYYGDGTVSVEVLDDRFAIETSNEAEPVVD